MSEALGAVLFALLLVGGFAVPSLLGRLQQQPWWTHVVLTIRWRRQERARRDVPTGDGFVERVRVSWEGEPRG